MSGQPRRNMSGQPRRFRSGGHHRRAPPPAEGQAPASFLNPNFIHNNVIPCLPNTMYLPTYQYPQNPVVNLQGSNSSISASNFPIGVSSLAPNVFPNQGFQPRPSRSRVSIERIDRAVAKARDDLLAAREAVSAWKVSQSALMALQVESWDSLGLQMQQVPSLHHLIVTEGKINSFIHCFVAVQRITSLYELEVAICNNEGILQFEELGLGLLLRHPLVEHYFSVSSDVAEVFKITSNEIIYHLYEFMDQQKGTEISAEEFLDFIAKKHSVTGKEKLGVRVQSLG
ncbi:hypothetical protein NMG60_11017358 [Bertholletia excelsa]